MILFTGHHFFQFYYLISWDKSAYLLYKDVNRYFNNFPNLSP